MKCTATCVQPSRSGAHCSTCHRTFGGVSGFDRHRRQGACLDPVRLGMSVNPRGVWTTPVNAAARARLKSLRS